MPRKHIDPANGVPPSSPAVAPTPKPRATLPRAGLTTSTVIDHHSRRKFLTPESMTPSRSSPDRFVDPGHFLSPTPLFINASTHRFLKKHNVAPVHDSLGVGNTVLGTVDKNTVASMHTGNGKRAGYKGLASRSGVNPLFATMPLRKQKPLVPAPFATDKPVSARWNNPSLVSRKKAFAGEGNDSFSAEAVAVANDSSSLLGTHASGKKHYNNSLTGEQQQQELRPERAHLGALDKKPASKLRFTPRVSRGPGLGLKTPRIIRGVRQMPVGHPSRNPITGKGAFGPTPRPHGPRTVNSVAAGRHHVAAPFDTSFARSPFAAPSGRGMRPKSAISRVCVFKQQALKF